MANRRQFLQMGAAALALPATLAAASPSLLPAAMHQPASSPLYKVIFDSRFSQSTAFAHETKRLGSAIAAISGDITDLWYKDLYYQWEQKPAAIAGLTTTASLFCLEQLARDHRMRVVYRADHVPQVNGTIEHRLSGPESLLQQEINQTYGSSDWPYRMAALVSHYPTRPSQRIKTTVISRAIQTQPVPKMEPLVSWVIAPQ